ncbi:MAG TPA: hypothetical protein VHA73_16420 [Acidimicrobiales bacterium]|nr:hypothetical protein [Acidimicrobiales bacterium]
MIRVPEVAASAGEQEWIAVGDAVHRAGERLAQLTAHLDDRERADGFRALTRALNNHLSRLERDRERPELVSFNGWREKFFMDNPDFRYWVADIRDDRRYRLSGAVGDSVFQSITVYRGDGLGAVATARVDTDTLDIDAGGRFEVTLAPSDPGVGTWLPLEPGVTMVWVRHFHEDVDHDRLGDCTIEPHDPPATPTAFDAHDVQRQLRRLAASISIVPEVFEATWKAEEGRANQLRHWSEMSGGAAFTEPGIHYVRGAWSLGADEALVIRGSAVPSRYWNILLYSRYLNSLDYRSRTVSRTSGTARLVDGRYGFVLAARQPAGDLDWLDTEGRQFGLVVMRWLLPEEPVPLPEVRVCHVDEVEDLSR